MTQSTEEVQEAALGVADSTGELISPLLFLFQH